MNRPSSDRRQRLDRRNRSLRGFLPAVQPLEQRQLMSADLEGDTLSGALAVSLTRGALYRHQGTIGDGDNADKDVDFYSVNMAANQRLTVVAEARYLTEGGSLSNLDSLIRIFDASGTQKLSNDSGYNPFIGSGYVGQYTADPALEFIAPSAGTYYVGVSGSWNANYAPNSTSGVGNPFGADYRLGMVLSNSPQQAAVGSGFSATSPSPTQVNLSWSGASGATGYTVERSPNGSTGWTPVGTVSGTTFTDTGLAPGTNYSYRVQATNGDSLAPYSSRANVMTLPAAPDGLAAVAVSGSRIDLSWINRSANISSTSVEQSTNGTNWSSIGSAQGNATSFTATGPFNGSTPYYFRVRTITTNYATSAYSSVSSITTPAFPNRPTISSTSVLSDTSIALSWTAVAGANGYRVERAVNYGTTWSIAGTVASGATNFTDSGLTESTGYSYRLIALNDRGESAFSVSSNAATQPTAPTGLTLTAVSGGQVNLGWTNRSSSATAIYIEQSVNGTNWQQISGLSGQPTSYVATGPFNGSTTYYFRIRSAAVTGGNSAYATASVTTPAFPNQPTLNSATATSNTTIALSWADVAGESSYRIERSPNGNSPWTALSTVPADVTSYTDSGIPESTNYFYRLVAANGSGDSAISITRSATTQPTAPTGLSVTAVSPTQINLTWTNRSATATSYYVEQSADGTTGWSTIGSVNGSGATTYTATGPFNGATSYYYRVRAYGPGQYSAYAPVASVTTPAYPSRPTLSTATPQSDAIIALAWTATTGASGYRVERSTNNGSTWTAVGTTASGVTTFNDTGLAESTNYTYRLVATNDVGASAASPTLGATTQPAAPTGLTVSPTSWKQINIAWTKRSATAVNNYVDQSSDGTNWQQIAAVGSSVTSYTATGPFNGSTPYYFRVRAYAYTGGYSAYATASATTPAFPNAPAAATATAASDTSVRLTWQDGTGETGYRIERLSGSTWAAAGTVGADVTAFTETGLTQLTSYSYRVVATNGMGDSAPGATVAVSTPPSAPTGLAVTPVSGSRIDLNWTNRSSSATTYIEQSSDGVAWQQIGQVAAGVSTYSVAGTFARSTTYSFRVRAYATVNYYTALYSSYATASATTPAYPYAPAINWTAAQSSSSIALSWTDAPGETGFRVERSNNNGSTWATAATVGAGVTTFTDAGLAESTNYTYRVIATNGAGSSPASATQSVVTPPGTPSNLTTAVISGGQINLSWTKNSTAASTYSIEQSTNGSTGWQQIGSVGATVTSYTATGPFNGSTTYFFRVRAYSSTGGYSGPATSSLSTPAFPSQPVISSATTASDTSVNLAWVDVAGEASYRIERSNNNGTTWATAGTVAANVTTFTDTGLAEATNYTYRVVATNGSGNSAPSNTRSSTTLPAAPTGLSAAVVSGGQVNLTWTNRSAVASSYSIQQSLDGVTGWTLVGSVSGTGTNSYSATGPFNGSTTYYFRVYAYASFGGNSAAAMVSATMPAFVNQPTLNSATAASDTTVVLSWSDVANETGYRVERSTNNGSTWTAAGTVTAGVTSFLDVGLLVTTAYTYRVVATNAVGDSASSVTRSVTTQPTAPSGLTATGVSPNQVNLSWTNNSTSPYYYYIEQSADGATWQQLNYVYGASATSYTATGPFNGSSTYYFRVRAGSSGYSAYTTASVTMPGFPGQPTLNSASAASDTSIALAWSDVAGETGFRVERSNNNGSTWATAATVGAGVTTFTDAGLAESTNYTYRVVATNGVGDSAVSATRAATTPPATPTGPTISVVSGGRVDLAWTNRSTTATNYYVEQSVNGTTWQQVGSVAGTVSAYTATGPFNGSTTYYFRVRSYAYTGGYSAYTAVTPVNTPGFASQPTLNPATAQSDTAVALVWAAVAGATGFRVERSDNGGSTWATTGTVAAGVTTFTDAGLAEATSYTYRVVATNGAGDSAPSVTRAVATQPAAPTGLSAVVISGSQAVLTWTNRSSAASSYTIQQSVNGTNWQQLGSVAGTASSYTATGPFNGSSNYYFRILAYSYTGGNSTYATTSATTPAFPNQPRPSVTAQSESTVTLSWADVADETGYRIERSTNNGSTWSVVGSVAADATSFTNEGLGEYTSYSYRLVALNASGESASSAVVSTTTLPATPSNLTALVVSSTRIDLSWTNRSAVMTPSFMIDQSTDGVTWQRAGSVYGQNIYTFSASGPFDGSKTYQFRVYFNTGGSSTPTITTVTTPAFPNQPVWVSATASSDSAVSLVWAAVAGADGYRIERANGSSAAWSVIGSAAASATSYTDAGLREATAFTYRVVAINAIGDSAPGATRNVTTLLAAPVGLVANPIAGNRVDLSWSNRSSVATSYVVDQSTNGTTWQQIGVVNDPGAISYTASGPFAPSTTYYFRVRASAFSGNSSYATTSSTTPAFPAQPTLNAATIQSEAAVSLSWTATSGATGYRVERSVSNSSVWFSAGTVAQDVTTFTDTGLAEATSYTYRVVATNNSGDSSPSVTRTVVTTPTSPMNLTANVISGGRVDLVWTNRSAVATAYYVERSIDGIAWQQIGTAGPNAGAFSAVGVFNGSTTYSFRVRAYANPGGNSSYTNIATVTTPAFPEQPAISSAVASSDASVTLTWSDVAGEDAYRVERSADNGTTWVIAGTITAQTTSFVDSGLQEAKSYGYRVVASNAMGDSAPSTSRNVATQPKAPTGLTGTVISGDRIDLAWTDRSAAESGYLIERSADGANGWQQVGTVAANGTIYSVAGPFGGSTIYYFRVRANATVGGYSAYTSTLSVTTPAFPAQPSGLTTTALSESGVRVAWLDVAGEDGYRVERSTDGNNWTQVGSAGAGSTSFVDTGLQESGRYYYRVLAFNAAGTSARSTAANTLTLPAAPENVSFAVISGEQINLTWTDRSRGEGGFRIEQFTDANSSWASLGTVSANVTSFTATGPFNGSTTYYFRIRAYNTSGDSAANVASVVTPAFPNAPTGLVVTSLSPTSVGLGWATSPDATSYRISRRIGAGAWFDIGTAAAGATSFLDTTVVAGTVYTYGVAAIAGADASGRARTGPALARDGSADQDGDELTNLQEANIGTDPTYFDTDGDLLPDGWEVKYSGFDPKSANPAQGDSDNDGLTNLGEYTHHTNPTTSDTDGDGVSDSTEVDSGADPNDASDGGKSPAEDMKGKFRLTVGDDSGSHSERWALEVGDVRYVSPNYGEVGYDDFTFKSGKSYDVRLKHVGTNLSTPDYDWTASIAPTPGKPELPFFITDGDDILGSHYPSDQNTAAGKVGRLHLPQLDVDVDSDNNEGFDNPGRTEQEDRLERTTDGAKILTADTGDVDGDGVPDYADFDGIEGRKFVPIILSLSDNLRYADPTKIEYTFTYDASDATATLRTGSGTADDPYVYKRASGSLRIWRKDATAARDKDSDYIHTGEKITAADLGLQPGGTVTLYVEAVAGSTSYLSVDVAAAVTGDKWSGTLKDSIYFASTETRYVLIDENGGLTPVDEIPFSNPAPVFSGVSFSIDPSSLQFDPYTGQILGNVIISGQLADAASDLIQGSEGTIGTVGLYLNGDTSPLTLISTNISKDAGNGSLARPYAFSATFSTTLQGVNLQAGWNTFHLEAVNAHGTSGHAIGSISIDLTPPTVDSQGTIGLGVGVRLTFDGDPYVNSSASLAVRYNLGGGQWSQPITLTRDPNAPSNTLRFTDGENTVDLTDPATLNPQAVDQYAAIITLPKAALIGAAMSLLESGNDTGEFSGSITLDEIDLADSFTGYQVGVGAVTGVTTSSPGEFKPILIEVVGPEELRANLKEMTVADPSNPDQTDQGPRKPENYKPVETQGRSFLGRSGSNSPTPFLMMNSPKRSTTPTRTQQRKDGTWNFATGFAAGIMDTGVSLWEGVKSVVSGTWHVFKNYNPFTVGYRYAVGESIVTVEDQQAAYAAWDTGEAIAGVAKMIMQDQHDIIYATLTGDNDELNRLGEKYSLAFEFAIELLEEIRDQISSMDAYDGGRIVGRIVGETVVNIGASLATGGGALVAKSATMTQVITKLKSISYLAPIWNKLDDILNVYKAIQTSNMCFVAGTLVHTAGGLRPIESLSEGELVLSRDEQTGEQGYKPVLARVVTRPVRLLHVGYRAESGDEKVLVGTGEHPFYVVNREAFVPAGELAVGDTLLLADGSRAAVVSLGSQDAGDGPAFTTYNIEVADYHTYFVGDEGVWVHNVGTICERLASFYNRLRVRENLDPWPAFKKLMEKSAHVKNVVDSHLLTAAKAAMDDAYALATRFPTLVNLEKIPSYAQVMGSMSGRLSGGSLRLQVHHSVPKYVQKLLGMSDATADLDSVPAIILTQKEHTGSGVGFHSILKKIIREKAKPGDYTRQQLLDGLEKAYTDWGRPDVWAVSKEWLRQRGIQ